MIYDGIDMKKFIEKMFYFTYRSLYPRYGRNPKDAYIHMALSTWATVLFATIIICKNMFYIKTGTITYVITMVLSFVYIYWVVLYKKKYIDIILNNKATPLQCVIYALLYNIALPLFISFLLVFYFA